MEANGPSASEGRLRSPAGAYTSVQSPEGVPVFGASEASEDGSKRPERSEGRLRSPAGAYTSVRSPEGGRLWDTMSHRYVFLKINF